MKEQEDFANLAAQKLQEQRERSHGKKDQPTPRTDAQVFEPCNCDDCVPADFARQLEREMAEALKLIRAYEDARLRSAPSAVVPSEAVAEAKRRLRRCIKLFHNADIHWNDEMIAEFEDGAPKDMTLLDWIDDGIERCARSATRLTAATPPADTAKNGVVEYKPDETTTRLLHENKELRRQLERTNAQYQSLKNDPGH